MYTCRNVLLTFPARRELNSLARIRLAVPVLRRHRHLVHCRRLQTPQHVSDRVQRSVRIRCRNHQLVHMRLGVPVLMAIVMLAAVRRHIAGRHLPEAQEILDDRRQALRLPDQIVRHRFGRLRRRLEHGRHRSAGQLQLGARKAQLVGRPALEGAQVLFAHLLDDQHVLGTRVQSSRLADREVVRCVRGVLASDTLVVGDRQSAVEPVHARNGVGDDVALEIGAVRQLGVDDAGGCLHLGGNWEYTMRDSCSIDYRYL